MTYARRNDKPGKPFKKGEDPRRNMSGPNANPEKKKPGRKPGMPNKTTVQLREAFTRLVEGNVDRVQAWLDEIAENDGALQAMKVYLDLAEFCVPKMARIEHTGKDGAPFVVTLQQDDAAL